MIRRADRELIDSSGLFDAAWYLNRYPDIRNYRAGPLVHYLKFGWREGRDPGPLFRANIYISRHPEVAKEKINPLLHYLRDAATSRSDPRLTLDSLFESGIHHIDFVKIDTQGSEFLILKGAQKMLRSNVGHLRMVVEFTPSFMRHILGAKPAEFFPYLHGLGFRLRYFDRLNDKICNLDPAEDSSLIERVEKTDGETWRKGESFADIVCEGLAG